MDSALLVEIFISDVGKNSLNKKLVPEDFQWKTNSGSCRDFESLFSHMESVLSKTVDGIEFMDLRSIASDDVVIYETAATTRMLNGDIYKNPYCFIVDLIDGKIKCVMEYDNTLRFSQIFSRLYLRPTPAISSLLPFR